MIEPTLHNVAASELAALFEPIRLGRLELPNRIAMAPMARFRCRENGVPEAYVKTYYEQRAGAGLILGDSVYVDPRGRMSRYLGGLETDEQQAAWSEVAVRVHAADGRIFLSLIHSGRVSECDLQVGGARPVAPSAIAPRQEHVPRIKAVTPRALGTHEVEGVTAAFGRSARRAVDAGFDGVEMHAANGYLGAQFLASRSNCRSDRYGGTVARRCRFVVEALEAIILHIGADRTGLKVSPGFRHHDNVDDDPVGTHVELLRQLRDFGLAYVHVQSPLDVFGLFHELPFDPVKLVREHFGGVVLHSGNLDRARAARGIAAGQFDVAAFGRRFVANPDLPERFHGGYPENELRVETLDTPGPQGYIDYPAFSDR